MSDGTLEVPPELRKTLETGDFVLFVGAGASIEAGLPGWEGALAAIAAALRPHSRKYAELIEEDARAGRYLQAADLLYLAPVSNTTRAQILQSVFDGPITITRRLKLLTLTRCQGIVTTNFDRSLEVALTDTHTDFVKFTESGNDLVNARIASSRFLLRMHGRIEVPEGLVFAERHYSQLLDNEPYVEFFRELFQHRNLLFFGFSFRDPVIRDLIRSMSKAVRSIFRRSAFALFPTRPSPEIAELLLEAHITPIMYPQDDNHAAAWNLLERFREGPAAPAPEMFEAQRVQNFLALAYARAKAKAFSADRIRVLSATLIPILSDIGRGSVIRLDNFLTRAETMLALPISLGRGALQEAVKLLVQDGLILLEDGEILVGDIPAPTELEADSERLVRGIVARAEARYGTSMAERVRPQLKAALLKALTLDGLYLAHGMIRGTPTQSHRLSVILDEVFMNSELGEPTLRGAREALEDLVAHPDREEERILANVSVVVFTTTILLMDPALMERAASPFEAGAYVDASVLLPWLSVGHPLCEPYEAIFKAFGSKRIRILEGYLNEIIAHRRIAVDAYRAAGFEDRERLRRYASFFELHNINTFLGGYAGVLQADFHGSFDDYLAKYAPFEGEESGAHFLESQGLVIERTRRRGRSPRFGELKAALKDNFKRREDIVIEHDAEQLDALCSIEASPSSPYFITADRSLISAIAATGARRVLRKVLLPQQVGYLAQFADRGQGQFERFSRLLWGSSGKIVGRIRQYYTDRVLKEYEFALLSELPRLVESLMKEIGQEQVNEEIGVRRGEGETERIKVFDFIDRFEPRFYEHLMEAKKRAGLKG